MRENDIASERAVAFADMDPKEARAIFRRMPRSKRRTLIWSREFWLRPKQLWQPTHHRYAIAMAGRGFGKTMMGAHAVRHVAENPELCGGRARRSKRDRTNGEGGVIGIAGRTANDVNQTMIYGPSGIMAISPPWFRPTHHKSDRTLSWPNGVVARLMSADVPDSFRGPNFGFVWADEMPHWRRLRATWDNVEFSLRIGEKARALITTTPLGVQPLIELVYECDEQGFPIPDADAPGGYKPNPRSLVIRGTSYENMANLSDEFVQDTIGRYAGTEVGRQEVEGELIIGIEQALWRMDWFDRNEAFPRMVRVVIGVDPAGSKKRKSAETGIVAVGLGEDERIYLLEDGSGKYSPREWAEKVIDLYHKFGATAIAVERNQGADMVESNIRTHARHAVKVVGVVAHKSKGDRARLVNQNWELGLVTHCGDHHQWREMERQMTQFDPTKTEGDQASDRMDAAVWGVIHLLGGGDDLSKLKALGSKDIWQAVQRTKKKREQVGGGAAERERRRRERRKRYGGEIAELLELVPREAMETLGEELVADSLRLAA